MDLYLQDLGRKRQTALLRWRAVSVSNQSYGSRREGSVVSLPAAARDEGTPQRLGVLGRFWARGTDSPPEVAAAGLDAMRGQVNGMVGGFVGGSFGFWMPAIALAASGQPAMGLLMGTCGAIMSSVGLWIPGHWLWRICRSPLSAGEVDALQASAPDELEQAYLRLAADVVRQSAAPEVTERFRAAMRALGDAIDQLPAVVIPRAGVETLRAEAAQAESEARQETDAVVAASHARRADALHRSADAAQMSQTLMRRSAALREEMMAQIESMRLGLAGFQTASGDVSGLVLLADAVRTVATESLSVASARAELAASLSDLPTMEPILRLHRGD